MARAGGKDATMAVTMKKIAEAQGVSIATVSRVLSGSEDSVSDEVRRSILETAKRLGYEPRRKIGRTVAFLIDTEMFNLSSLFYTNIISAAEKEVAARRYFFQFSAISSSEIPLNRLNLKFNDLAGVVIVGTYDREFLIRLRTQRIPVILVDYAVPTEDIDAILVDNVDGIMKAGKHLAELGHRRVAYISGTIDGLSAQERRHGFNLARAAYGFIEEPDLVEECPESMSGGFEAMQRILGRRDARRPTAVIAYNDMVAIGAMDAIKQQGLVIPGEMSIVGFDDLSLSSEVMPPLTTVQVPKELMGRLAVETLFFTISGRSNFTRKILLPTMLVVRESTAAPNINGIDR
jgi:LacI family transcriptional regulator